MDESGAEDLAELRRHYRGAREAVAGHMFGLGMDGVTAPSVETALYRMYEVGLVHGHGDCPQVGPSDVLADPSDPGVSHYTTGRKRVIGKAWMRCCSRCFRPMTCRACGRLAGGWLKSIARKGLDKYALRTYIECVGGRRRPALDPASSAEAA
jgi:hypothetical protein